MKLVIGRRAAGHLTDIRGYIAERNPVAARQVVERIHETMRRLSEYPHSAGLPPAVGVMQASVPRLPYIVTYRIRDEYIEILGVFHAARHPSVRSRK